MLHLRGVRPVVTTTWLWSAQSAQGGGEVVSGLSLSPKGSSAPVPAKRSLLAVRRRRDSRGGPETGLRALRHLRTSAGADAGTLCMSPCGSFLANDASCGV